MAHKIWFTILALMIASFSQTLSYAQDRDPCGELNFPWRVVLLVDASGSMGMGTEIHKNNLWDEMIDVLKQQVNELPDETQLQIVVFYSESRRNDPRGIEEAVYREISDTGQEGLNDKTAKVAIQSLDILKDKMEVTEEATNRKNRFLPIGGTPLYYSVIKAIDSQINWVNEDPEIRMSTLIVYSDGDDNVRDISGIGFGKNGWLTKNSPTNFNDLKRSLENLKKIDHDSNVVRVLMGEWKRVLPDEEGNCPEGYHKMPADDDHETEWCEGDGGAWPNVVTLHPGAKIQIPIKLTISPVPSLIKPIDKNSVSLYFDVWSQCPSLTGGLEVEIKEITSPDKIHFSFEPRSIPLNEEAFQRSEITLVIEDRDVQKAESGFSFQVEFKHPKVDSNRPIDGTKTVTITIPPQLKPPVLDGKVIVNPTIIIPGKTVILNYPISKRPPGAVAIWERSDGQVITPTKTSWRSETVFESVGEYQVKLKAERDGLESNSLETTVKVVDAHLAPTIISKSPYLVGDTIKFNVVKKGKLPISYYEWKSTFSSSAGEIKIGRNEVEEVEFNFPQSGVATIKVRGVVDQGAEKADRTDWFTFDLDIEPKKDIYVKVRSKEYADDAYVHPWCEFLPLEIVTFSSLDTVTAEIVGSDLDLVSAQFPPRVGVGVSKSTCNLEVWLPKSETEIVLRVTAGALVKEYNIKPRKPDFSIGNYSPQLTGMELQPSENILFEFSLDGEFGCVDECEVKLTDDSGSEIVSCSSSIGPDGEVRCKVTIPDSLQVNSEIHAVIICKDKDGDILTSDSKEWDFAFKIPVPAYQINVFDAAVNGDVPLEDKSTFQWGVEGSFSILPGDQVNSVEWELRDEDTKELIKTSSDTNFKYPCKGKQGSYRLSAKVKWGNSAEFVEPPSQLINVLWVKPKYAIHVPEGSNIPWGSQATFELKHQDETSYIKSIEWILRDSKGIEHPVLNSAFTFRDTSDYTLLARVTPIIPMADLFEVGPFPISVTVETGISTISWPKGTEVRASGTFEPLIKLGGSVKSAELILEYSDKTKSPPIALPISGTTYEESFYHPFTVTNADPYGPIKVSLQVYRPGESTPEVIPCGEVRHRQRIKFEYLAPALVFLMIIGYWILRFFSGNTPRLWEIEIASKKTDLEDLNRSNYVITEKVSSYWSRSFGDPSAKISLAQINELFNQSHDLDESDKPGNWLETNTDEIIICEALPYEFKVKYKEEYDSHGIFTGTDCRGNCIKKNDWQSVGTGSLWTNVIQHPGFTFDKLICIVTVLVVIFVCFKCIQWWT
jgi:hypothetical protein